MPSKKITGLIQTKASRLRTAKLTDFKVTTFTEHRPSSKATESTKIKQNTVEAANTFNMKRARHEVLNFGISGLNSENKALAQVALAIKLGAKAPKNQQKNYKEILTERKQQQKEKQAKDQLQQLGKNGQGLAVVTYKKIQKAKLKRKLNGEIGKHYGVVNPKMKGKKKK